MSLGSPRQAHDPALQLARDGIAAARKCLDTGDGPGALAAMVELGGVDLPFSAQRPLARLVDRVAEALPALPTVRIAFGADATLDDLVALLRWRLLLEGWRLEALILPFGTWPQQLRDPASALYRFEPELVWLFTEGTAADLAGAVQQRPQQAPDEVQSQCAALAAAARQLQEHSGALVIVNNVVPRAWPALGNLDSALPGGQANAVQLLNTSLPAALPAGASVFDLAHLASSHGLVRWEDARLWVHSRHPFALEAHGLVAQAMARLVLAAKGRSRKCLVVDLDNTLWGGVIGDDGVDGIVVGADNGAAGQSFQNFQHWLKALAQRGVVLAVCSKNDEAVARAAFEQRPGMALGLADFAAFRANWRNKADNLRDIAAELNLGLDALVFVDDNPAERALVRRELPQVAVPELPADPADFVAAVARGRWFETLGVSDEDRLRSRAYQDNSRRAGAAAAATDLPSYLHDLAMQARWAAVDGATVQRFAQLLNKTNQFNLTTRRCTEAQIGRMLTEPRFWLGQFALADRFGDHGLIAAVIVEFEADCARIDSWAMSCRVFSRTMEHFIFGVLVDLARDRGCSSLQGRFIPSPKNSIVADLYAGFGGAPSAESVDGATVWNFDLATLAFAASPYIGVTEAPQR